MIHAPAGFGKTTLAAQWRDRLASEGQAVAWMTLDPDDDNPVRLLAHLIEAVRSVRPEVAENLLDLLEQQADRADRQVLAILINQIEAARAPLYLIVDDWHRVRDPRVIAAMEFLLDSAPPQLRLVITSRTRAGLPLGRLRVRDQLVEVDESLLRFDSIESEELLVGINGLPLTADEIAGLLETTEGWAAALQLALLSLRDEQDLSGLIRNLSGSQLSIDAYLAENVLDRLPVDVLNFLLWTALPERISVDLAITLTGDPQARATLEWIETNDLFLRSLDADRIWFRYHHLFVEFLRRRLERDHRAEIPGLHLRASRWFARNGFISEAVDHALAAGEPVLAVATVAERAMALFDQSRLATLLGLVGKLPRELVGDSARLQIALGWTYCVLQEQDKAAGALAEAGRALRLNHPVDATVEQDSLSSERRLLRVSIDIYQDRVEDSDDLVLELLDQADSLRPWLVVVAANIDTLLNLHRYNFTAARRRQVWAQRFNQRIGGPMVSMLGLALAAIAALEDLDVAGAQAHLADALGQGSRETDDRSYVNLMALAQYGALKYELGDVNAADEYLFAARDVAESGLADFLITLYVIPARIRALRADLPAAAEHLAKGATVARDLGLARLAAAVFEEQARLGLPSTDQPPVAVPGPDGRAQQGISGAVADRLVAARIHRALHTGSVPAVRALLPEAQALLARVEAQHRPLAALRARVLLAATLHRAGKPAEARDCLIPALQVGARTGLIAPISDGGAPVAEILGAIAFTARAAGRSPIVDGVPHAYLATVKQHANEWIQRLTVAGPEIGTGIGGATRLSRREMEILRLLDAGRSNQQIASAMNLSTNTVKWYLKSLYQKFDVTRRQECVAAARASGLLS